VSWLILIPATVAKGGIPVIASVGRWPDAAERFDVAPLAVRTGLADTAQALVRSGHRPGATLAD
jgi:hypothetical protein